MTADEIIEHLHLAPHPEGGWYRQTWEGDERPRACGTCIYFLLKEGETSRWHRVDATEIWHHYTGAPLELRIAETDEGPTILHRLGPNLAAGHAPQVIVPKDHWQSARATTGWALVGCTVSPGFTFDGFELAPPGFNIR